MYDRRHRANLHKHLCGCQDALVQTMLHAVFLRLFGGASGKGPLAARSCILALGCKIGFAELSHVPFSPVNMPDVLSDILLATFIMIMFLIGQRTGNWAKQPSSQ